MILALLLFLINVEARVNPIGPTVISDFSSCILQITEIDFKNQGLLIFGNNINASTPVRRIKSNILDHIHRSMKFSIEITSSSDVAICGEDDKIPVVSYTLDLSKHILIANYFILIIDRHQDLYYLLNKLIHSHTWNPRAKFLVLLYHFTPDDRSNEEIIENILTCLYKYNVIDIVIMVPKANNIRNAVIYSWSPYDPPSYCGYINETARNRLLRENICEKGRLKYTRSVFRNKIPFDMKGCTLFLIALDRQPFISSDDEDPNIEKHLIDEVVKVFNFSLNYEILELNRGEREEGEWDGALKELITKKGDVLLGGIFPDDDVHEDFDCSSSYLYDAFMWVVPRADSSPRWVALTIIFKQTVWLAVFVIFIICAGVWKIIGLLSDDSMYNRTFSHNILNTWLCTLGLCTYTRPKTHSLRTFFVFLNLYSVMCFTAYTAKLIDVLRNPTFEYQIKTVEELINSGIKFGGFEELHDIYNDTDDPIDKYIFDEWITVDDINKALLDVTVHRNFSLLCSRLELDHLTAMIPELSDRFGRYKYYAFTTNVFSVPMEMIALKGYPFLPAFSDTMGLLKQCGLTAKLRKYFSNYNLKKKAKLLRFLKIQQHKVDALSIEHLQGGFLALILGYSAGAVILFFEIIWNSEFARNKIKHIKTSLKKYKYL